MKERLDVILVEQGYAPSREKAKAIIMSGNVYVNGQKEDKAGTGRFEQCFWGGEGWQKTEACVERKNRRKRA